MKAIQKTKSKKLLSERVTAMEGDPRGALATWGRRMAMRTRSIFIVLRQRPFLSLYSYLTSRRIFSLWRSRTYIQNLRHVRIAGVTSSFLFGLLALAIIIPLYNVTGTEDTEAATGTAIDSSITFTSTRVTATVDLTPTSASGTFASSTSGTTDAAFSITTTNSQGYELKIKSTSGTVLKPTTTTSDSDGLSTITTSGITSSSFTNNTWGYLPNYYNCNEASGACTTNTTNYYPATTSDVTLRKTTSANTTAHNYTIGLGAKADLTKTSGTYTLGGNKGSLVLTYVANPTAYEITYRDNSGDSTVANMPTTTQSGSVSATSIALAPNRTPTRTGYSLTGWCLGEVTSAGTSCSGTTIATNGSLALDRTTSNSATLYAIWTPYKYTCTKQYRLQNADGTWGNYTTDTTEQVDYNSTCSYSKTVTNYKGSEAGTNGSAATNSATMNSTNGITVQVSLWRNTYALTVTAGSNTSSATGGGTYRWGQTVTVGVTKASNTTCISYATPTWSRTSGSGTLNATSGTSVTFTMTTSSATVTASSSASNVAQTITLSRGTGTSGITIAGTNYTGTSASLNCGTYNITGTFPTGYKFSSWSRADGVTVASTNTLATTMTVSGAGTLTLNGTPNTYSLSVTFAGSGVSSVQVRTASGTGGTLMGTVSSSGGSVSGLAYNSTYYLYPVFSSGYEFSSWAKTSSTGTLSSTTTSNPTFTMGAGNGAVTITGKSSCTTATNLTGTMQSFSPSSSYCNGSSGTLTDSRDNKTYTVKKINGQWWMTQNLAIGCNGSGSTYGSSVSSKSLTSGNSNVSSTWSTPTALLSTSANSSSTSGYTTAAMQCSSTYGAWYNYAAATAGTITGSSNDTAATKDICPAGWHLPTGPSTTSGTDFNILVGNTTSGWQDPTTGLTAFSAVAGGLYRYGSLRNTGYGYWWSATAGNTTYRYSLIYNSSNSTFYGVDFGDRYLGYYVRCVRS